MTGPSSDLSGAEVIVEEGNFFKGFLIGMALSIPFHVLFWVWFFTR